MFSLQGRDEDTLQRLRRRSVVIRQETGSPKLQHDLTVRVRVCVCVMGRGTTVELLQTPVFI